MTSEQIYFYIIIGIVLVLYVRRQLLARSLANYSGEEAKQKVASGSILLDVRTTGERKANSIPKSLHIPVQELSARIKELEKYRGKEIICYCASGRRSVTAALKLKKAGFKVGNLKGGIGTWNFSNL
ncbi:MAG: rhodanese-like domain-containing protein [Bacteroidota bacterium]